MVSTLPQEGSFQRTIAMHGSPTASNQQQQTVPMDGVNSTGTTGGGQQAMDITATQDSASTTNDASTTIPLPPPPPPQSQTKLSQNVFVHKLYKYGQMPKIVVFQTWMLMLL